MTGREDFSSRIWLIGPDGQQIVEMAASKYDREADFQSILAAHPALIDGKQVDPDDPRRWLLVSQEAVVPDAEAGRWALDHLFVDQDGVATLVEVKRKSDTRLRREVVGQMLDYAANGSLRWTAAYLGDAFAATCLAAGIEPDESLAEFLGDPERVPAFWEMVDSNLRAGRMRLLFVADEVPAELLRIVEFLNKHMSATQVLALELRHFSCGGFSTHVPRILGRTLAAVSNKEHPGGGQPAAAAGTVRVSWRTCGSDSTAGRPGMSLSSLMRVPGISSSPGAPAPLRVLSRRDVLEFRCEGRSP